MFVSYTRVKIPDLYMEVCVIVCAWVCVSCVRIKC